MRLLRLPVVLFVMLALALPGAAPAQQGDGALLLRDFRILTMAGEEPEVIEQGAVLVEGGRIVAMGADAIARAPADARVIEGDGRTLMPGLIDMHVHIWAEAGLAANLAHGVTSVRNMSGMPYHLAYRERIAAGELLGPRLYTTGPILNSQGPNAQINHQIVETAEEARAAVRGQYAQGFRDLKLYSNIRREAYEAILDEAAALGMTITGHPVEGFRAEGVPQSRPFEIAFDELLDDGFVTIEHVESIVWHALYDRLDEAEARALARRIAEAGVTVTPTLLAHRNLLEVADSDGAFATRPGTDTLNPFIVALAQEDYRFWAEQPHGVRRDFDAFFARVTRILAEEGVRLVTGSDSGIFANIPGQSEHEEIALLVDAGLTPYQALRAATADAADVLDPELRAGRIAPGHAADMIVLDGDPLADIAALDGISGIVAAGRWIDPAGIAALMASARTADAEETRLRLFEGLAAQGTALPAGLAE